MGNMASQMEQQIQADGGSGLATPVPGTGETPEGSQSPPAGAINADTTGGPPETIPYARFKEVNDRLQGLSEYEQLRQYGYDSDSLSRLAQFEAAYLSDPIGTWKSMADNLDLPPEIAAALAQLDGAQTSGDDSGAQGESSDSMGTAEPTKEVQELLEWKRVQEERELDQVSQRLLDESLSHWDSLDKQAGLDKPTSLKTKLTYIAALGNRGSYSSPQELAVAARGEHMEEREAILGGAVHGVGNSTGAPLAVPGSGVAASQPVKFNSLKEASKAAQAAIERGELPRLGE